MTHEHNDYAESVLSELDGDRLRQAVEQVRRNPVPEDSLRRALDRAQDLTSVTLAVRRQPALERDSIWKARTVIGSLCLLLLLGALALTIGDAVQDAREAARRAQTVNNLKQIGIAMQSYHDTHRQLPGITVDSISSSVSKIIRSAQIVLVVERIAKAELQLNELVQRFHGEIGNSEVSEPTGQPRSARWVVKMPIDSVDAFLREVVELGTPENRSTNSRDVTDEYIDLETRIASKKQLEKRILDVLEKNTGGIKDILAVEEELARVREEIEKMEGRVKRIDAVTTMTTVEISARELRDYVPPQTASFSTEIGRAWSGSMAVLQNFGKSLVLVAVAAVPWLPVVVALIFICAQAIKRRKSRRGDV